MTLELSVLELETIKRLKPLSDALTEYGIPVNCLPKLAGAYSEDEIGQIAVFVASATGVTGNPLDLVAQDVELTVTVNLSLGKRYQDVPGERNVLEYCADQAIGLLLGFYPYPQEVMKRPFFFKNYELFRPNGNRWEAQINFGCVKQLRSTAIEPEYEVVKVQLFNSLDLLTGALVSEVRQ